MLPTYKLHAVCRIYIHGQQKLERWMQMTFISVISTGNIELLRASAQDLHAAVGLSPRTCSFMKLKLTSRDDGGLVFAAASAAANQANAHNTGLDGVKAMRLRD